VNGHSIVTKLAGQNFAMCGQPGKKPTIPGVGLNVDIQKTAAKGVTGGSGEIVEAQPRPGRDTDGMRMAGLQPFPAHAISEGIHLVEHKEGVLHINTKFFQHTIHGDNLLLNLRAGGICHMQEQVCLLGLFQGCLEAGDKVMGQITDEADRIADQHRPPAWQLPASGTGIESGKEFVLSQHTGSSEGIEQGALSCIGVAHQRDSSLFVSGGHLPLPATMNRQQLLLQIMNPFFHQTAVNLKLLFPWATHANAHLQAGQVRPHPFQPRQ
jgi:hypothetical protein